MSSNGNSRDSDPSAKVYVGDLGSGGSKPDLEREFEKFGPLKSVWVARNPPGNGVSIDHGGAFQKGGNVTGSVNLP